MKAQNNVKFFFYHSETDSNDVTNYKDTQLHKKPQTKLSMKWKADYM